MTTKDFALWGLLAWLWGSSFLAIGIGVETLTPVELVTGRMILGAGVLIAALRLAGGSLTMGRRGWALASVLGITGNVIPFLLIGYAGTQVDTGLSALIMGIAPVVTICLAPLVHADERLTHKKLLGGALGFGGILVLVGPSALAGVGAAVLPQIALIGAALCYALTALLSRRFAYDDPLQMATGSVVAGAVGMALVSLSMGAVPVLADVSARSWLALIYLGIGPTALAALIYFHLVPRIGAGRVQQINNVVPVLGTVLGMIVLAERPGLTTFAAIALVMAAVTLVTYPTAPKT